MDYQPIDLRLDCLRITEEAIEYFTERKEEANTGKMTAIANNQDSAKLLYEEKIKIATEQVNFYKSVKEKIVNDLTSLPQYQAYLGEIGMTKKEDTTIQMR